MTEQQQELYKFDTRPTIKGFPELRWTGKRPYRSTVYYPAQLRETYGQAAKGGENDGWLNKIFWGDNLQVMSHLLRDYRGKVDLIYIDPPFDSKADYKKKIQLHGKTVTNDASSFEEKQYGDIWTNDEYLQFMYERLILCRELLADTGSIYLHCDWHKNHHLRALLDEVFGVNQFINEIIWCYSIGGKSKAFFARKHDTILWYAKGSNFTFNGTDPDVVVERKPNSHMRVKTDENGRQFQEKTDKKSGKVYRYYVDEGKIPEDYWTDIEQLNRGDIQRAGYPTQKPEGLIRRIIAASSNPGDLVFDCFMGSGTTQAVAMKLGRRFVGADINLGAIQTTTKRLVGLQKELKVEGEASSGRLTIGEKEGRSTDQKLTGFEVYNVNNYDFFRNPVEAKSLLMQALEVQPFPQSEVFDGELDGRMVKIMPVNRIATKADLAELVANLPYRTFEKRREEHPDRPVVQITLVCMGHEPDLKASLEQELSEYNIDVEIVDILRDRADLQLKREAEAEVVREGDKLVIRQFYPLNLMQKLSLQREVVTDWRELVDSIMIDFNFDGVVMEPTLTDVPDKISTVTGIYDIPADAGVIKVKITDVLSESLEIEVK